MATKKTGRKKAARSTPTSKTSTAPRKTSADRLAVTPVSLTAKQLASLELLIAKKQASPNAVEFNDAVADHAGNVAANATIAAVGAGAVGATPAAGITAGIGAVAAGIAVATRGWLLPEDDSSDRAQELRKTLNDVARAMPLEGLITLRNMALAAKQKPKR